MSFNRCPFELKKCIFVFALDLSKFVFIYTFEMPENSKKISVKIAFYFGESRVCSFNYILVTFLLHNVYCTFYNNGYLLEKRG
jgi:hypothetical protein